jgi:hypothetical protein
MSEQSESYMRGWQSGYHNATLAERDRITRLLQDQWIFQDVESYENYLTVISLIKGEPK